MTAWIAALVTLLAPPDVLVRGTVLDRQGAAVRRALVVSGDRLVETDGRGRFELRLEAGAELTVLCEGYEPFRTTVADAAGDLRIVLKPQSLALVESVSVIARPEDGPGAPHQLTPLQVVKTPDSAADVLRALQALPGVVKVDDGAGLFVRGGDTREVLVLLDDVPIFHPYRQETPTGGFFGTVPPFLLDGLSFSTGGFSARYGNALSAVLDLRGRGRPESRRSAATLGLAGFSVDWARPLGTAAGVQVSGNRSFPGLLLAVNGVDRRYDPPPGGWDANLAAHLDSARLGRFRAFGSVLSDQVGVEVESLTFRDLLRATSRSQVAGLRWDRPVAGRWLVSAAVGMSAFRQGTQAGVLDLQSRDRHQSWRLDTAGPSRGWTLAVGIDGDRTHNRTTLQVPSRGGDLEGVEGTERFEYQVRDLHVGVYAEAVRSFGRVTVQAGVRGDRFRGIDDLTLDPRLSSVVALGGSHRLRLAWGLYHQAPPLSVQGITGAPGALSPQRAVHWVAGHSFGSEQGRLFVRTEAYRKDYHALPLYHPGADFASDGHGWAKGLDVFLQARSASVELRAAYSFLAARRRWTAFEERGPDRPPEQPWPPDFAIPHTLNVSAEWKVTAGLSATAGWRSSSGRPVTPVLGATRTEDGHVPIFGPMNSERLPGYNRSSLAVTYLTTVLRSSAILFASVSNLLNRANVSDYAYSPDYSERRPVTTGWSRTLYVGLHLSR